MRRLIAMMGLASCVAGPPCFAQQCATCTPLIDLGAGLYLDQYQGGLYPGGSNRPPPAHLNAALELAREIVPLDDSGAPNQNDGIVAFISIGMSNTSQEFSVFQSLENSNPSKHPRLVVLNTAQGGQSADRINSADAEYWSNILIRLEQFGLSPQQVQVVWLKQAHASPLPTFPEHALALEADLRWIVRHLQTLFPNLKLCYCSSRIFGGYSANDLRNEPLSFETGFAFKWLIEDQLAGDPELNFDPQLGPVEAPLLLWSAYLWANGDSPRSDGLIWVPDDFQPDMVHPSDLGRAKVADLLLEFFSTDPTTQAWHQAPCPGDGDSDGAVDFGDITSVLGHWGADYGLAVNGPGDADDSGFVDFADVTSTLANWGASCP